MNGLSKAQRSYDRQLPDEGRQRAEREFEHPEFAPAGVNVIRSSKFIDLPMADRNEPKRASRLKPFSISVEYRACRPTVGSLVGKAPSKTFGGANGDAERRVPTLTGAKTWTR